ncbi:DUF7010 family protein [Hymenobacter sp. PAMC 26628]|uniref:DUF7010 family protein n=1 Tax=Hymenobacter sp. PAMC 26628 TaxID=1484118 RepID=UPI00077041B4|nr:hypothetical protein [Hymenobacter sp. PAMC 26628]AMJ64166.1 hypothetical protein AXW84_00990 [Hymenobacter sp. PAMC 26628]
MHAHDLTALKLELSVKAKNGVDFIAAATLLWVAIAFVWAQPTSPAHRGFLTFCLSGLMLPLAFGFSKVFRTTWTIPGNPLQPLGLWLNVAQLFYFPFLVFIYLRQPAYFILVYGVITGAHLFPYAWFYHEKAFAVLAGVMAIGCLVIGLNTSVATLYYLPVFMAGALAVLGVMLFASYQKRAAQLPLGAPAIA